MDTAIINTMESYLSSVGDLLDKVDMNALQNVFDVMQHARNEGKRIFLAGNGGSAATAMHWSNDLNKRTKLSGQRPAKVMCLSANTSWITALANDEGYENIFSAQMDNFAEEGDVLILISASGSSPNLLEAAKKAKEKKVYTVAMLGFDGGKLKNMVDEMLWIQTPKGQYEQVEDLHSVLCHTLTVGLTSDKKVTTASC